MANELSNLAPNPGSRKTRMRVGRGEGSGKGRNAGRGTKGDKSRSGHKVRAYFEGGQMPLHRRLPKRGFFNQFSKDFEVVNLEKLGDVEAGTQVTADFLADAGIISRVGKDGVKLLGRGEITVALHVKLAKVSDSARAKIVAAGGTVETPSDVAAAE
jgi:large subunit ribosomal protein L15